jgi:hypothetical protein
VNLIFWVRSIELTYIGGPPMMAVIVGGHVKVDTKVDQKHI